MLDTTAFLQGLSLGLGVFICPGPKDIVIIKQALLRQSPAQLIAIGVFSDIVLIAIGLAGLSATLAKLPQLQNLAIGIGVTLMLLHGLKAAKNVFKPVSQITLHGTNQQTSINNTPLIQHDTRALLIVSFLNPLAWLDTVLIIGTIGAAKPYSVKLIFALGAISASFIWFVAIVFAARGAKRWVTAPNTWRNLEVFTAVSMFVMALLVILGIY